jgi:hypothetical protein
MYTDSDYFVLEFGIAGVAVSANWVLMGRLAQAAAEVRWTLPTACRLVQIDVRALAAPGGAITDTISVFRNGIVTGAIVIMGPAAVTGQWLIVAPSVAAIDYAANGQVSVQLVSSAGGTALADVGIALTFQKQV